MKPADNIKRYFKNAAVNTNPKTDEAVFEGMLIAHEKTESTNSAIIRPNIRNIIMKNPITKLAAAAGIIIAVFLVIHFSGGPDMANVAWGEVLEKTEEIPTVVFDMTAEITQSEGRKLVFPSRNYVAGDYGTRSDIFLDGKLNIIKYRLPIKKVAYQIRVDQKKYQRIDMSDEEAAKGRDTDDPRTWLEMILSGDYTKLGCSTINGVVAEGIESNRPDMVGKDGILRLWVDVETNLPVQIVAQMPGMEGGQMRPHKYIMENFQWNVELDESIFEPDIPDDYTMIEIPNSPVSHTKAQPEEQSTTESDIAKEAVRGFLNACAEEDWDTVSKFLPYMEISPRIKDINAELQIIHIGESSKTANGEGWLVPYEIKFKGGGIQKNTMELKQDKDTGQLIVLGGF